MDFVPKGWIHLKEVDCAFISEDGTKILLTGYPSEDENDHGHDCDYMGCGWSHVIVRAKVTHYKVKE